MSTERPWDALEGAEIYDDLMERLKDFELGCVADQLGVEQGLIEHRFRITLSCELDAMGRSPRHAFDLLVVAQKLAPPRQVIPGSLQEHFRVLDASIVECDDEDFAMMFYLLRVEISYEIACFAQSAKQAHEQVRSWVHVPEQAELVELQIERLELA